MGRKVEDLSFKEITQGYGFLYENLPCWQIDGGMSSIVGEDLITFVFMDRVTALIWLGILPSSPQVGSVNSQPLEAGYLLRHF